MQVFTWIRRERTKTGGRLQKCEIFLICGVLCSCADWLRVMSVQCPCYVLYICSIAERWEKCCWIAGRVLDAAALIMRAVAAGGENAAAPMREAALTEGAMLHHLAVGMSAAGVRPTGFNNANGSF